MSANWPPYTVIRFVEIATSSKFGFCTVVGVKGAFDKMRTFKGESDILASTSVPFRPTTVQVPNLVLTDTKRKIV